MKSPRQFVAAVINRVFAPLVSDRARLPYLNFLENVRGCGPELAHLRNFLAGTRVAIDIGANCGLFTYRLSKRFECVHAFEINPPIAKPIQDYNSGRITVHLCGLSSTSGVARFYVPKFRGLILYGWGSLNSDNLPAAEELIEMDVQLKTLDEFGIDDVDFIKIDVEGHEFDVLRGGHATIQKSRPILLIESREDCLDAVDNWFKALDFERLSLQKLFRQREPNPNHLFVPIEKLSQLNLGVR
jgi:FkbM family methyltransferase